MFGITRLICEATQGKQDGAEQKVFDVPKSEAKNLQLRLQKAGWIVSVFDL